MFDVEFEQFAHHALYLMDTRVAKLNNFAALNANDMVMLLVPVRLFKLRHVFAKLVFGHQIAGNQQFQGVVYRGAANAVLFIFHVDIQRFHIEMVVSGINFFKNSVALRRLAEAFVFEVSLKNFFYCLVVFRLSHHPKVKRTNLH